MILFVFEGRKREPFIFDTMEKLFFPYHEERMVCTYNSNIYSLYAKLKEYDVFDSVDTSADTVSVLNEILLMKGDRTLEGIAASDVSEIYLFFDYDFQESRDSLEANNEKVKQMLAYFNEETENGRLYINYPMVESIRYSKELPDADYTNYTVTREDCLNFKAKVNEFSFYKSYDYLLYPNNANEKEEKREQHIRNLYGVWQMLTHMNVVKAHYICTGIPAVPKQKGLVEQEVIFRNQLLKYVGKSPCSVAVLNSFPLFLYEYFNVSKLFADEVQIK